MTMPHKMCPHCQQAAFLETIACTRCGYVYPPTDPKVIAAWANHSLMPETQTGTAEGCPRCGEMRAIPISAVVRGGTWTGIETGQAVGVGLLDGSVAIGGYSGQVSGQTLLARFLAPPQLPRELRRDLPPEDWPLYVKVMVVGILCGIVLLVGSTTLPHGDFLSIPGGICLVVGLLCIWPSSVRSREIDLQRPIAEELLSRQVRVWEKLLYCSTCDHVFDPATRMAVRPSDVADLWPNSVSVSTPVVQQHTPPVPPQPTIKITTTRKPYKLLYTILCLIVFVIVCSLLIHQSGNEALPTPADNVAPLEMPQPPTGLAPQPSQPADSTEKTADPSAAQSQTPEQPDVRGGGLTGLPGVSSEQQQSQMSAPTQQITVTVDGTDYQVDWRGSSAPRTADKDRIKKAIREAKKRGADTGETLYQPQP
jgi:ribosomal protein S27AE